MKNPFTQEKQRKKTNRLIDKIFLNSIKRNSRKKPNKKSINEKILKINDKNKKKN